MPQKQINSLDQSMSNYKWSHAYNSFIVENLNDLFYYSLKKKTAVKITSKKAFRKEIDFSPNLNLLSFIKNNNLYVIDLNKIKTTQLTFDGNNQLLNGLLDWVYQEEIYGRYNFRGYWWSPDSKYIAFLQSDTSKVDEFPIVNNIPYKTKLLKMKYPKAGSNNSRVRLGIINIKSKKIRWIENYNPTNLLYVSVSWTPDSKSLVYQLQNREQTWLDLNLVKPATGEQETLLREKTSAWVNVNGKPLWLKDGSFLWLSERDGYKHIYHYHKSGELIRQITKGKWNVCNLYGINTKSQTIFFLSNKDNLTERHLYSVKLNGTDLAKITIREGTHDIYFNNDLTLYFDYWSDINTPKQISLYDNNGNFIKTIHQNITSFKFQKPKFLSVETRDNFEMQAMMLLPPNFDPRKKYPVLCYIYGGPDTPAVKNKYQGDIYAWHQLMVQKGYIIWICDNRASCLKGAVHSWKVYKNLGKQELCDTHDSIKWLCSQTYVNSNRIGIWGWSYGGYMTCYALTNSKKFKMGIAVAPVTDWNNYDSVYTERYMKKPQKNKKGYLESSPVYNASNLYGKLLLVHGTDDDNVHMQNSLQFAYALQQAGKPFQMMIYPKSKHGINDPQLSYHLFSLMTKFVLENL